MGVRKWGGGGRGCGRRREGAETEEICGKIQDCGKVQDDLTGIPLRKSLLLLRVYFPWKFFKGYGWQKKREMGSKNWNSIVNNFGNLLRGFQDAWNIYIHILRHI